MREKKRKKSWKKGGKISSEERKIRRKFRASTYLVRVSRERKKINMAAGEE